MHVTSIALANEISGGAHKLATDLAGLCLGAKVYPPIVMESPAALSRYAGSYQGSTFVAAKIDMQADALVYHLPGSPDKRLYPAGNGKFFAKSSDMEISFQATHDNKITGALVKIGLLEPRFEKRLDEAEAVQLARSLADRLAKGTASPGTEDALRHAVRELQEGTLDYKSMSPNLSALFHHIFDSQRSLIRSLGSMKSINFKGVAPAGSDIFTVVFDKGSLESRIAIGADGRLENLIFEPTS